MNYFSRARCALFGAALLCSTQAGAGVYSFSSAPISYDTQLSLGFTFTTNATVTVTGLGYFDYQGDGFATPHEVGIFAGDGAAAPGALLASALLSVGSVNSLNGDFRYAPIAPLVLAAGQTFTIAGTSYGGSDPWVYGGPASGLSGFAVDPRISIGFDAARYFYQNDNILRDPSFHYRDYQIYAVNFTISSGVPELSTWAMMLLGLIGLGLATRRRPSPPAASLF